MQIMCPRCKDVRSTPEEQRKYLERGDIKCGACLMDACEVVAFIEVEPHNIGHDGRVAYFPKEHSK